MNARDLPLDADWSLAQSPAGAWATPTDAETGSWFPAEVPGTAAMALERAGLWNRATPTPLHDKDVWYRRTLVGDGPATLVFEGLATIAEIWLDDRLIARSESMFQPLEVPVTLAGAHALALAFRSLAADVAARKGPRARWRTRMVEDARLRFVRTTLLGHAPGWCPPVHAVGPWRPVRLRRGAPPRLHHVRSELVGNEGHLTVAIAWPDVTPAARPTLLAGGQKAPLAQDGDGVWRGTLRIPQVEPWWPRTHGEPHLYEMRVETSAETISLGRTGFRTLTVDRGSDGSDFRLRINEVPIFCRGVCWTPDLVALSSTRERIEPVLRAFADAHVNMVRVSGTMVYEADAFHHLCDELGILVWQDCMLANFDYPREDAFVETLLSEVKALLHRTVASPSLAVVCGGSEILQQAAMMGLPPQAAAHPLFDKRLPALLQVERPDVAYVPGSPSGGALPFVVDAGPSHYYGVGAYQRPLEDARRANVRFAAECLAFANVPEDATLHAFDLDPARDPERWARGVPRDNGAAWTFEDTRHHYMARLHGVDPAVLRRDDPQRYLDLSRAVTAEVTERTYDEWRRPGSPTGGALVWLGRDLDPGAGWGVLDVTGRPKSNFHAMRRAFAPLRLMITDEGVNGLAVHCVNDGATAVEGRLALECLRQGAVRVIQGCRDIVVPPRGGLTLSAFSLFGHFFDAGQAYGFGEAPHDTVFATLTATGGIVQAEAHWVPDHARSVRHDIAPTVELEDAPDGWRMILRAERALTSVVISDAALVPDDNWFHLVPGTPKLLRLAPLAGQPADSPRGEIRASNLRRPLRYTSGRNAP